MQVFSTFQDKCYRRPHAYEVINDLPASPTPSPSSSSTTTAAPQPLLSVASDQTISLADQPENAASLLEETTKC